MEAAPKKLSAEEQMLQLISERLQQLGDLPIFSASVNRVQMVSSDPSADAIGLSKEILKDASLSTRVLRVANSMFYSRSGNKVGMLSKAIILMGFDAIKNTVLAMKLLDSFQKNDKHNNLSSMLINAYMTAGFVRELAQEAGVRYSEQSYICGLLHNVGEVIAAYTLPDKYAEVKDMVAQGQTWAQAQMKVFHMPFRKIGQYVLRQWEFPDAVTNTLNPYVKSGYALGAKREAELNTALSSLGAMMMDAVYSEKPKSDLGVDELQKELARVAGVSAEAIDKCLKQSFQQSCALAQEYGLDKRSLKPSSVTTADSDQSRQRQVLVNELIVENFGDESLETEEVLAEQGDGYDDVPSEVGDSGTGAHAGDAEVFIAILGELTNLIASRAHINSVFHQILEGICRGVGLDRAMICLISPDHKSYSARMVAGADKDRLKSFFRNIPVDVDHDLFSAVVMQGDELRIGDINKGGWQENLPGGFVQKTGTRGIVIAAVQVQGRPIGLVYGDRHRKETSITEQQEKMFMQLVNQLKLALQMR